MYYVILIFLVQIHKCTHKYFHITEDLTSEPTGYFLTNSNNRQLLTAQNLHEDLMKTLYG